MNLFCKNKPSGGKSDPNMPNPMNNVIGLQFDINLHFLARMRICKCIMSCVLMCWHKSPKRGTLKEKCAFGPFMYCFGD
jgi:hypothetical protein